MRAGEGVEGVEGAVHHGLLNGFVRKKKKKKKGAREVPRLLSFSSEIVCVGNGFFFFLFLSPGRAIGILT